MFPNLLEATREYWRQLDQLELAYQQGEIPIEEVDARVKELMAELSNQRRLAWRYLGQSWQSWLSESGNVALAIAIISLATYLWYLT